MTRIARGLITAAIVFGMTARGAAAAQGAEPSEPLLKSGGLEEIVVTARRHEEDISKVPVSVSAFTQENMDQKGVRDISDLIRFTPGISVDTTGLNTVSIRGIASSGGAGTTGIYIDDTPIQMRALSFNPDDTLPRTFDLERVEVLRGPQGTLFGAGSEGGTVRYILAQPSLSSSSTYARTEVAYTQHGAPSYEAGIAQGTPVIEGVLGLRAGAWFRRDGGWIDRVDPFSGRPVDKNANHVDTTVLRLAAVWRPAGNVTVTPGVIYQNSQRHDVSTYWAAYSDVGNGQFNNAFPERNPVPDRYYLPSMKVEVDLGHTSFFSNTSYYNRREKTGYSGTAYNLGYYQLFGFPDAALGLGIYAPYLDPSVYPLIDYRGIHLPSTLQSYRSPATVTNLQDSLTQEFRLQSQDPSDRWRWTVGAFYSRNLQTSIVEQYDPQANTLLDGLYGKSVIDLFGVPLLPNGDSYYSKYDSTEWQLAGFGDISYSINARLQLTVGARISRTSFRVNEFADGPQNFGASTGAASQSETPVTPKVSLSYQADPKNLIYATYAKGFRPGGGNPELPPFCDSGVSEFGYANGQAPRTYNSDSTQSYEIGSKNSLGNSFRLAASVFYIKWNGIQQSLFVPTCGYQFTDNLGSAVSKGFDLQAEAVLGSHLTMDGSVGYTNARFVADSRGALVMAGDAISGAGAGGNPGTIPPWTIALGAQYNAPDRLGGLYTRIDYTYKSRNPWLSPLQDPRSSQYAPYTYTLPATQVVTLRAGLRMGDWSISFFVENLLDSHTTAGYSYFGVNPFDPVQPSSPAYDNHTFRPRTFGLTATFRK
jgi:iron complex outermembrane receptor protein